MTVENVKERTVVRSVKAHSEAAEVGVLSDSLLIRVGDMDTHTLSHTETLEVLRHATRPVQLKFRIVNPQSLQRRRAEMRALVHQNSQNSQLQTRNQLLEWCEERVQAVLRLLCVAYAMSETRADNLADPAARGNRTQSSDVDAVVERLANVLRRTHEAVMINVRREVLLSTRLSTVGEVLNELQKHMDWESEVLWMVDRDLRDIVCTLLQLDIDYIFGPASQFGQPGLFLEKIISRLDDSSCVYQCTPLLCRLASSTSISSRITCANLLPGVYHRLPLAEQLCVRGILNRLVSDDNVLVRAHSVYVAGLMLPIVDLSGLHWLVILAEVRLTLKRNVPPNPFSTDRRSRRKMMIGLFDFVRWTCA
jgi:hypothetical protein